MHIAITICATKSYTYAMIAQARRIQSAILELSKCTGIIILVGDDDLKDIERLYRSILPEGWEVMRISDEYEDGHQNYKKPAQLIIARMRSIAFTEARRRNVDICLSMDSDVLPQNNSILCMKQMLEFDSGYYDITCCPYPSQGGGDFLCGRGTPERPILPDIYADERLVPDELKARIELHKAMPRNIDDKPSEAWEEERKAIAEEMKKAPPKGDAFFLNSRTGVIPFAEELRKKIACGDCPEWALGKLDEVMENWKPSGFRRRGWHSSAYSGIGIGAVLPIDWSGFGCTMMSKKALGLAQFDGYDGDGTEDLYVVWKRWHRQGLRLCSIPHSPCDHVIRTKEGGFTLLQAHHETADAECVGHLRIESRPWFQQADGEVAKS